MRTIEIHPWVDVVDCSDRLISDLDPAPDVPFVALKLAAQDLWRRIKRKVLIPC